MIVAIVNGACTLLGVALGWLLNYFSRKGKLHIYTTWKEKFEMNSYGSFIPAQSREEAKYYNYELFVEIYNSSADPLIMRKIEVEYNNQSRELFRLCPDSITEQSNGYYKFKDEIMSATIPGKTVVMLKLCGALYDSDEKFTKLWDVKRIYFSYRDVKDKEQRMAIVEEDYSLYFDNNPAI